MSREDQVEMDGVVEGEPGGGFFTVRMANDHVVKAKLCGKMVQFKIRVVVGDKVKVAMSPYDLTQGRIIKRDRGQ